MMTAPPPQASGPTPVYAYPPTPPSGQATAALIFGIVGLFIWPLALVAVILGHVVVSRIRRGQYIGGWGSAIAGLVLGWIVVGPAVVILVVAMFMSLV